MRILLSGTKGGPGKSTVGLNLGCGLAHDGHSVLFIDGDKQRTLAKWHARRIDNGHQPAMALVEKRGNLFATIAEQAKHYDYVIIDVAGDDNEEMRSAMTIADLMLVVLRPSQFDAETLEEFAPLITTARNFNPNLEARALFSQVPTYNGETETEDVEDYVRDFPELTALKSTIAHRKIYRDSVADGRGVLEMSTSSRSQGAAKREIRSLLEEVNR